MMIKNIITPTIIVGAIVGRCTALFGNWNFGPVGRETTLPSQESYFGGLTNNGQESTLPEILQLGELLTQRENMDFINQVISTSPLHGMKDYWLNQERRENNKDLSPCNTCTKTTILQVIDDTVHNIKNACNGKQKMKQLCELLQRNPDVIVGYISGKVKPVNLAVTHCVGIGRCQSHEGIKILETNPFETNQWTGFMGKPQRGQLQLMLTHPKMQEQFSKIVDLDFPNQYQGLTNRINKELRIVTDFPEEQIIQQEIENQGKTSKYYYSRQQCEKCVDVASMINLKQRIDNTINHCLVHSPQLRSVSQVCQAAFELPGMVVGNILSTASTKGFGEGFCIGQGFCDQYSPVLTGGINSGIVNGNPWYIEQGQRYQPGMEDIQLNYNGQYQNKQNEKPHRGYEQPREQKEELVYH